MAVDDRALIQLLEYTRTAIDAQDSHVADQLHAALAAGNAAFTITDVYGEPHADVTVDGHHVCRVDVRNLVPLDDL